MKKLINLIALVFLINVNMANANDETPNEVEKSFGMLW